MNTITLVGIGSRGDLEPLLTLGAELRERGHRVRVATHGDLAHLVRDAGLAYLPLPGSAAALFSAPEFIREMRQAPSTRRFARALRAQPVGDAAVDAIVTMRRYIDDAVRGSDLVVGGPALQESMALAPLPVPYARVSWYPDTPTRRWPAMGAPDLPLGGSYRLLTHRIMSERMASQQRRFARVARRTRGIDVPGKRQPPELTFHLSSTATVPEPEDWPTDVLMTGPWLSRSVRLDDGPPDSWWSTEPRPIVIGFGSLWPVIPTEWVPKILAALRTTGRRIVLVGGPPVQCDGVVVQCTSLDFHRRLPHAHLLIHHGGHGTGSTALVAGTPQVITPLFIDHPWWAKQMRRLGAAPAPVALGAAIGSESAADSYAERLRAAVEQVDERMIVRARALAETARTRDRGVDASVERIEEWFERGGLT